MPLEPRPRSTKTPRNKSKRAAAAEARGERTWTGWRLAHLIDQVVRANKMGVTSADLKAVRNLEYLKVKLLVRTEQHHTGLRMPPPLGSKQDQYYGVDPSRAERLSMGEIQRWIAEPPSDDELDEAVENLTGRKYYRERRR